MDTSLICTIAGPAISVIVSALKKIPLVKRYPKFVTFFISAVVGSFTSIHGAVAGISYADLIQCVLIQFSTAVATHEAVTNQVQKVIPLGVDNTTPSNPNDFNRPGSL